MKKKTAKIKNWNILPHSVGEYYLAGVICEDEVNRGFIGKLIQTSLLLKIDFKNRIAETKNTIYQLD